MLLFSQGCLDLDVTGNITTIKQKLKKYFPDENIATDKTSIFDCVDECFTKTNYCIYYVSLIIIVVIWIPFHESSVRIVMWTPFNKTSENCYIYHCPVDTVQQNLCENCYIYYCHVDTVQQNLCENC